MRVLTTSFVLIAGIVAAAACASSDKSSTSSALQNGDPSPGASGSVGGPTPPSPYPGQVGPPSSIDGVPIPPECQNPGFPGGDQHVDFAALRAALVAQKGDAKARQVALLAARYDLSDRPSSTVRMSRGKPVQVGVRVKLAEGQTWSALAARCHRIGSGRARRSQPASWCSRIRTTPSADSSSGSR